MTIKTALLRAYRMRRRLMKIIIMMVIILSKARQYNKDKKIRENWVDSFEVHCEQQHDSRIVYKRRGARG